VPLGTFTGSTPDPGESLALRETDAGGAGVDVVWPQFLAITAIGAVFFLVALARFRKAVTLTQV